MDSKLIKVILIVVVIVVIGFGLLKITDAFSTEGHAVLNEQPNIDEQTAGEPQPLSTEQTQSAEYAQPTGEVKVFEIKAFQFYFEPDTITVNRGDVVNLHLESRDVTHGFALPEFGINEILELGKDVHVDFVADKAGEFMFYCSVPCGSGHGAMRGQLIVRE